MSATTGLDSQWAAAPLLCYEAACHSQMGNYHERNEDRAVYTDHFFAVADGVGGGRNGDVAAETILEHCAGLAGWQDAEALRQGVLHGEQLVRNRLRELSRDKGATTLAAAWLQASGQGWITWVGDVRIYRLACRNAEIELSCLTMDHTYGNLGEISPQGNPDNLARMIGVGAIGQPPVEPVILAKGDSLLICSDGLYRFLDEDSLRQQVQMLASPMADLNALCRQLVDAALANGGYDDCTALVVSFRPVPDCQPLRENRVTTASVPISTRPGLVWPRRWSWIGVGLWLSSLVLAAAAGYWQRGQQILPPLAAPLASIAIPSCPSERPLIMPADLPGCSCIQPAPVIDQPVIGTPPVKSRRLQTHRHQNLSAGNSASAPNSQPAPAAAVISAEPASVHSDSGEKQ